MRELSLTPQARKVLAHLEKTGSITAIDALNNYGIFRLAGRIHEIRRIGIDVETQHKKHPVTGKQYGKYLLMKKTTH